MVVPWEWSGWTGPIQSEGKRWVSQTDWLQDISLTFASKSLLLLPRENTVISEEANDHIYRFFEEQQLWVICTLTRIYGKWLMFYLMNDLFGDAAQWVKFCLSSVHCFITFTYFSLKWNKASKTILCHRQNGCRDCAHFTENEIVSQKYQYPSLRAHSW